MDINNYIEYLNSQGCISFIYENANGLHICCNCNLTVGTRWFICSRYMISYHRGTMVIRNNVLLDVHSFINCNIIRMPTDHILAGLIVIYMAPVCLL